MNTFVNYHKHDCYSNLISPDSAVLPKEYIKRAKELNHKMVFCTNHGNPYHYYEMYQLCKKEDLKFGFGVEAYWVKDRFEKDNTNNHIIILAKSEKGRKAINLILSEANKNGFYYKPRIDIELIMSLPENEVMITTACLGFYGYENWEEYIYKFYSKFKDNFYLEFQPHLTQSQIDLNKKLLNISKKNNIKMIAGLDSHYIYQEQKIDRDLFLYSKGIVYEEEEGWFMDYPDYKTLYNRFKNQNIFKSEEIIEMIDNTNICLTFDDIKLDFENIKIPTMHPNKTQEEKDNILKEIIKKELKIKFNGNSIPKEYSEEIKKEWKVIKETKMSDYFILNYHIIKRGIELGGNITLTGRGCFTKDAIVLTENNLKPINEIKIGDKVLSENGKFNKVINTFEYEIEEDMIEFQYEKQGSSYKKYINMCTLDHKILTKEGWKQAKDLNLNDKLCYPKIKYDTKDIVYDLLDYNFENYEYDDNFIYERRPVCVEYKYSPKWLYRNHGISHNWLKSIISNKEHKICRKKGLENYKRLFEVTNFKTIENYRNYCLKHGFIVNKIPRFIKMDYLWNVFIGMMYGDGWTNRESGIGFAINNTTKNGINKYVFYKIAKKLNMDVYVNKAKDKNLIQLFILSKIINNFFSTEFFKSKKGGNKTFNQKLINQNVENIRFLHMGLVKTDGSINKKENKICFDNTSLSLISAFKIMDNILGNYPLSLDVRLNHTDKRGFNNSESYKLRRSIIPKRNIIEEDDKYFYLPVNKIIKHKNIKTKVYDFNVENFQSYTINNIVVHNSSPSWYLCNVLGFTTIDMLKSPLQLFPERFATTDRIKAGSLFDIDFNVSNRPAFIQAQKEILGENNSYFFSAYGKLKEKSCWKMFAKANDIPFEISNEITKYIDKYEKAKKYAETDEDKDDIMVEDFIPREYIDIYNGSKKYNGVIDSISPAPCGFLLSQYDIREDIGIVRVKDELCANIDGVTADKALMMKNDLLIVTVVDIIYETYKKIGRIPHTSNELIELTKDDKKVWEIFSSGNTVEINQCTNEKSKKRLSVYKPNNLAEISAFVSSIRPAFKSMVDKFINREYFEYGIVEFDKIIQTNEIKSSFILFQETLMRVLNYVGFDIAETYQLLKAIAKKKEGIIEPIKERFINGFIEKEQNGVENANKVWKIMEDSVSYGFNCSHSVAMGLDAMYGAYLKAYYPLEFYSTCIDIYTKKSNNERVAIIKGEMKNFGISEKGVKFKDDNRSIFYNKIEKTISPMLSSIKHINQNCANELYDIGLLQINHFIDILDNLKCTNSKQLNILVSLDYFSEFAKPKKLIRFIEKYEKYRNCKTINKEKCEDLDLVKKYCAKETDKQLKEIDNIGILKEIWGNLVNEDLPIIDKIKNEIEYLGYATTKDDCDENICTITGINTERSNPMLSLYFLSKGETDVIKIKNKLFNESEIEVFNMIKIMEVSDEFKWMPDGVDKNGKTKFKKGTEKEKILTKFKILS